MERPLHTPPLKPLIADGRLETGDEEIDAAALFAQFMVDKGALGRTHSERVGFGWVETRLRLLQQH